MQTFCQILRAWLGDRSVNAAAPLLQLSPGAVHNYLDEIALPPMTRLRALAPLLGLDLEELAAVVRLERRAKQAGLHLATVLAISDDGYLVRARAIDAKPGALRELKLRLLPQASGVPISVRAGDVIGTDGDIVCWSSVDERAALEAQRIRLAELAAQQRVAPTQRIAKRA